MARRIEQTHPAVVEDVDTQGIGSDVRAWLENAAPRVLGADGAWLLAHADDGVIWGRCLPVQATGDAPQLVLQPAPHNPQSPHAGTLRVGTLQAARLFSPRAELLLWRDSDDEWRARLIRDLPPGEMVPGVSRLGESFDEEQILWGDHGRALPATDGVTFVVMGDGAQGLRHRVPLPDAAGDHTVDNRADRPLRLRVRHYVAEDGDNTPSPGFTRVVVSRLYALTMKKGATR